MTGLARLALLAGLVVCSGPQASVRITEPPEGATVPGPALRVVLEASGVEIAPVAQGREGTAHHHVFLDADVTPAGEAMPVGRSGIVHLGGGQTEYTFDSVPPGRHRVIAVLGDLRHVPWQPPATDTVFVTVGP
jgi:hypothetical protein